jgi:hypothetical protein
MDRQAFDASEGTFVMIFSKIAVLAISNEATKRQT